MSAPTNVVPLIKLDNVSKVYRALEVETTALDRVSLSIDRGEYVSIVGPSGCGKSTLLAVLGMLDRYDDGDYWFNGLHIKKQGESARAAIRGENVGFIFQNFNLIEELTVKENIALALQYSSAQLDRRERESRMQQAMHRLGILHRAQHHPSQLSGGQQQRVAIARAWVSRPSVLLADEPTGNLDSFHGEDVMRLLAELNGEGVTLVVVTHAPEYAREARRVVEMRDGRILSDSRTGQMPLPA